MFAIQIDLDMGHTLTIIDVYFPCDSYANVDAYTDHLGKIYAFINDVITQDNLAMYSGVC